MHKSRLHTILECSQIPLAFDHEVYLAHQRSIAEEHVPFHTESYTR